MIVDTLANSSRYAYPYFKEAFDYLKSFDPASADARIPLIGDDLIVMIQTYTTATVADKKWEAHYNYLDIQYVFEGGETINFDFVDRLAVKTPYNPEKDVIIYEHPEIYNSVALRPGDYAVFYPEDAHQPGVSTTTPIQVRKVVFKIRLS